MTIVNNKPGVEVCIWIARDAKGKYTNAANGAMEEQKGGRVGHSALKIYPSDEDKLKFASLLAPDKDYVYVSLWPGRFETPHERDIELEGGIPNGLPNAIVRLNKLNISAMLAELSKVINTPNWTLKVGAITPLSQAQSCAGFVYKLLEIGGIFDNQIYGKSARYAGPKNWDFYDKTNCHIGDMLGGIFNAFSWRGWLVSPKLVLHISASAAESNYTDKQDTLALMNCSELVQGDSSALTARKTVETVATGSAALALVGYVAKKKLG